MPVSAIPPINPAQRFLVIVGLCVALAPHVAASDRIPHEILQGRWDGIGFEVGTRADEQKVCESIEFDGVRVISKTYPHDKTPRSSLFQSERRTPSTFSLDNSGPIPTISIFRPDKKVVVGKVFLRDGLLELWLEGIPQFGDNGQQTRFLYAWKAPDADGPNLRVEEVKRLHGYWMDQAAGGPLIWFFRNQMFLYYRKDVSGLRSVLPFPWSTPKRIDIREQHGEFRGIYRFVGDTLEICQDDAERPDSFEASAGNGWQLFKLKRIQKPARFSDVMPPKSSRDQAVDGAD